MKAIGSQFNSPYKSKYSFPRTNSKLEFPNKFQNSDLESSPDLPSCLSILHLYKIPSLSYWRAKIMMFF